MSSLKEKIRNTANQNNELLGILSESDYGPPALEEQQRYIKDISNELQQLESRIRELETKRAKEQKDHEKYRDSTMKRFAYKMSGKSEKFDMKASKEEKEYFDVLQEEHQAKDYQKSLQQNLSEAQKRKTELEQVTARHQKAQSDLDALYNSIFGGPTPELPEEDQKETAAKEAWESYQKLRSEFEAEQRAGSLLDQAQFKMRDAITAMSDAHSASQFDMWGGGTFADMEERDALSRAESSFQQASKLVLRAKNASPHVGELDEVNVAKGHTMSDILFDNVFSDYSFHQKIKESEGEMNRAAQGLQGECKRCQERLKTMDGQLKEQAGRLENARVELQNARIAAFERIAGGGK